MTNLLDIRKQKKDMANIMCNSKNLIKEKEVKRCQNKCLNRLLKVWKNDRTKDTWGIEIIKMSTKVF